MQESVGGDPPDTSEKCERVVDARMLTGDVARRVDMMPASLDFTVVGWICVTDAVRGVRASPTGPGAAPLRRMRQPPATSRVPFGRYASAIGPDAALPRRGCQGEAVSDAGEISEQASAIGPGWPGPRRWGGGSNVPRNGGRGLEVGDTPRGDGPRGEGRLNVRTSRGGGRRRSEVGGWKVVAPTLAGACRQCQNVRRRCPCRPARCRRWPCLAPAARCRTLPLSWSS